MRPARILVTGAGGFVGGHLVPALRAAFAGAAVDTERLDVTDRAAVFGQVAAMPPDICVHLAGVSAIGQAAADPARAWAVNLQGAINIAEAMMAKAPRCLLLFVSTAEVYGSSFLGGQPLDETAALNPTNLYAATKAAAELALGALAARGLRLLRLRPFNHTGPGQTEAFVLPAFAAQIARIEAGLMPPMIKVGALRPERDFLDVRDVCAAYTACINNAESLPNNQIINIASGQPTRIGDLLAMLLEQARCPITVQEDPAKLRPVEIARAVGNAGYARTALGWQPRIALRETVGMVLEEARRLQEASGSF